MSCLTKKKNNYFSNIFKIRIQTKSCMMSNKSYNNTYSTYFAGPLFGHPTVNSDFAIYSKVSINWAQTRLLWKYCFEYVNISTVEVKSKCRAASFASKIADSWFLLNLNRANPLTNKTLVEWVNNAYLSFDLFSGTSSD